MDLSIIIVSWNVKDMLLSNLKSIFASQGSFSFEVIVVDNSSSDDSKKMVKKTFPSVKLIANDNNVGFARANNQAIKEASGKYILLLNPDMELFPDTLSNMLAWMESNQQARVASCKLVDRQGKTIGSVRRFPRLYDQLMIILKIPHIIPSVLNSYLYKDFDYSKPQRVDSVRGSFFLIRNNGEKPYLDERYFIWFEEVDFCREMSKAGEEVWYTSSAKCLDQVGASFKQVKRLTTQRYFRNSMLEYFKKWHPRYQYIVLRIVWPLGLFLTLIFA